MSGPEAWFTHQDLVALAERRSFELTATGLWRPGCSCMFERLT